jgi:hypothetical protein
MAAKTKTDERKVRDEVYRKLITRASGKGWQILNEVESQWDTVTLLRAAARRAGLRVETNMWPNEITVTYRVDAVPTALVRKPRARKTEASAE